MGGRSQVTEIQPDLPWTPDDRASLERIRSVPLARAPRPQPAPADASPAPPVQTIHSVLRYPDVIVAVPRVVASAYGRRPWADVVAAATAGTDGLAFVDRPRWWRGLACEPPPDPRDVAFLAEGEDDWRGRTVLYQQNW
jgi:hypothetical protein